MPNHAVDRNSRARSACYPQGSFYPLSDGPSIRHHRITSTHFRPCSARRPLSQATLYAYTRRAISIRPEVTFARLRYSLGGDRPSQTARLALSHSMLQWPMVRTSSYKGRYPNVGSDKTKILSSQPPAYPVHRMTKFNTKLQ